MKQRWVNLLVVVSMMGVLSLAVVAAQTRVRSDRETVKAVAAPKIHAGMSPDQSYKANCTRCHAEVPKVDEKRSKTIIRHMRVRANMSQEEAAAILKYLTE